MTQYFKEEKLAIAKKQRNRILAVYFCVLAVFVILSVLSVIYYTTLPYAGYKNTSATITKIKVAHYILTGIFVVFSFIFLGIKYKRVRRYYIQCNHMVTGLKETSVGSFLEYDDNIQDKDGVDFKSLVFLEWNKYKKDFFERKVLVFYEEPFPEIPENANVTYVTQGNVLISYEILE